MSAQPKPEPELRKMRAGDLPAVMDVERSAYTFPWREGVFKDCLRRGHECWLLAQAEQLIGHSVLSVAAGESHLLNLCIHPQRQGQGLGLLLGRHILAQAKAREAQVVFLEVRPSNQAACCLYEKLGFNEIGVRQNYYPAPRGREDALVLAKHLLP